MKHHVVILIDSINIPGAYITEDWNVTEPDNEIPFRYLTEWVTDTGLHLKKFSVNELREWLGSNGFIKRVFAPPANPDSIPLDPEVADAIGGSASLVEIVLSGAAVISLFFFKANGLPKYQKVFNLEVPEE